jgi:thioredoxin 1
MGKTIEITDANFEKEVISSDVPVLIDFWAVWCAPCKMVAPIVENMATEYRGKLKVGKLDVDNNRQTAMKYGIRSIPTLLVFDKGKVVEQIIGAVSKSHLAEKLEPHLA